MTSRRGAEDARNHLAKLLAAAEHGHSTVITRRGRPVAVLAPVTGLESVEQQQSLLMLAGSGRGFWGADSTATLKAQRDEWDR